MGSPTFGVVETVTLVPGVEVLVPAGVANGFQAVVDGTQYLYCFDREWQPDMAGLACNPLDPALRIDWPVPIDPDDRSKVSAKDAAAPRLAELAGPILYEIVRDGGGRVHRLELRAPRPHDHRRHASRSSTP